MNKKIMELIKSDRFKPLFDQWRLAKKAAEAAAEVAAAFQSFYVPPADTGWALDEFGQAWSHETLKVGLFVHAASCISHELGVSTASPVTIHESVHPGT